MSEVEQLWSSPPSEAKPLASEVHLWRTRLDAPPALLAHLEESLSGDELARAGRYYFERDRNRFIVGRGVLRTILARYLATDPSRLEFSYGSYGKPSLTDMRGSAPLDFNLAHSQDLALCAVTSHRRIGIDVEMIRPIADAENIAARFFSARECAVFLALAEPERLSAFFRCWTRKEAFLKATGAGLSMGLDQFDVSLAAGEPAKLLNVAGRPEEAARWSLLDVPVGSEHAAAVAVEGPSGELRYYSWEFGSPLASAIDHS